MKKLLLFLLLVIYLPSKAQPFATEQYLESSGNTFNHPEKNILPFNAPCEDCEEDFSKRTGSTREFYKINSGGSKTVYMQRALGPINFKDEKGYWLSIDPIVKKESEKVFAARQQPAAVELDFGVKQTSITYSGKKFVFNKNLSLMHISAAGVETNFGSGDWSRMTRTENYTQTIFLFEDFYPGIDLQYVADQGRIESSFILKQKQQLNDGWLVMNQELEIPQELNADVTQASADKNNMLQGKILISDSHHKNYFYFNPAYAFDARQSVDAVAMPFKLAGSKLMHHVPLQWLNDAGRVYPVVIDPLVSVSDSAIVHLQGSGYNATCDSAGCSYFINNFTIPGGMEVTEINTYFSYFANLPCTRDQGKVEFIMKSALDTCVSRDIGCLGAVQGACFMWPAQLLNAVPPFSPCVPAPQCSAYDVDFEMLFRRCSFPTGGCDNTCILANSNWIMTVVGRTIEITNVTLPQSICEGSCVTIGALADWGAPPYTYIWQPGNDTGFVSVCPDSTTTYYVTATDTCGNTDTASTTITVYQGQGPGFSISPSDSVCQGTQLTFSGNGNAPDSAYSWIIDCFQIDTITDDRTINYPAPAATGPCYITMLFEVDSANVSCFFSETDTFYVISGLSPSVEILGDTICQGDSGIFTTVASAGGTSPYYEWYLNGVLIYSGIDSSEYILTANSGDELIVTMTSSDSCALGITVSDTILVFVIPTVIPAVNIAASTDTICSGDTITFNAVTGNGGNPTFEWYINGTLTGTDMLFTTTLDTGQAVTVVMHSDMACASPDSASDTAFVFVVPAVVPMVEITSPVDTVCAGDIVTFTASTINGGTAPQFQWFLNGNVMAGQTAATFTTTLSAGDTVQVEFVSNEMCADPDTLTAFIHLFIENCMNVDGIAQHIFSMHPNPANDVLNFEFSNGASTKDITIHDALGQIVFSARSIKAAAYKIDISHLSKAVYFVKVIEGEKEYIQQLVVH